MRILLDEDLPRRLGTFLLGHECLTVQRAGWSGIKNGKLLALACTKFDVFLTMDGGLEFQQNLTEILKELNHLPPRTLRRVRKAQ